VAPVIFIYDSIMDGRGRLTNVRPDLRVQIRSKVARRRYRGRSSSVYRNVPSTV